jgi:hypothetical protein
MNFLKARWKSAASEVTDEGRDDGGYEESGSRSMGSEKVRMMSTNED